MTRTRDKLRRRLSMYWQLELLNALVLPGVVLLLSRTQGALGFASLIAMIPMIGLLIGGGLFWRAKLLEITKKRTSPRLIATLARAQLPLLALTIVAAVAAGASVAFPEARASTFDAIVASAAAALAALEYVNYYHVQLQHFDNWADFCRLLTGRGLRRSKLSSDIARPRR